MRITNCKTGELLLRKKFILFCNTILLWSKSPVLYNGAKINGNLIIQNMRKYTLPCGMKINGHLFVRNVARLHFCGEFTVNGNIYVNRESSFGALPDGTKINGQIIF